MRHAFFKVPDVNINLSIYPSSFLVFPGLSSQTCPPLPPVLFCHVTLKCQLHKCIYQTSFKYQGWRSPLGSVNRTASQAFFSYPQQQSTPKKQQNIERCNWPIRVEYSLKRCNHNWLFTFSLVSGAVSPAWDILTVEITADNGPFCWSFNTQHRWWWKVGVEKKKQGYGMVMAY